MKTITKIASMLMLSTVVLTGCTKDNYDEPESFIKGRVVYEGEPLQLAGSEKVTLQLYQSGYEKHDPMNIHVNQDGEFSICIFDGNYQLITKAGNGPWSDAGRDTVYVDLHGKAEVDIPVTPYYLVENAEITLEGNKLKSSCDIKKVTGTNIDRAFVVLGTTKFLNDDSKHLVDRFDIDEAGGIASYNNGGHLTFAEKDYTNHQMFQTALSRGTLYARIGVWHKNADQAIYSEVIRLK